jgi:hypothetical protein
MRGEYSRVGAKVKDYTHHTSSSTVPLYLRTVATVSSWAALAGYTLFVLIFTSLRDNVKLSRSALVALASVLLTAGYAGAGTSFAFSRNSPSVQYKVIFLPFLLTSIAGLIEVVINHSLHKEFEVGKSSPYIYAPLIVASLTTVLFALLSFLAYLHIRKTPLSSTNIDRNIPAWETHAFSGGDPGQSTELLPSQAHAPLHSPYAKYEFSQSQSQQRNIDMNDIIPGDEAQRRQLLRLLLAREQPDRGPSPDASSTYRIDWPGDEGPSRPQHTRHLSVPSISRPRAGSAPSITDRWHMGNLLGRKRKPSLEMNKMEGEIPDAREVRRREIETNSLTGSRETLGLGLYSNASELDVTARGSRLSR